MSGNPHLDEDQDKDKEADEDCDSGLEPGRRDFAGRVFLITVLRALHIVGVVGCGAALFGVRPSAETEAYALLLIASGTGIVLLDLWANPEYFRQLSGLAIILKLLLLTASIWLVGIQAAIFWAVLVGSVLLSHAPKRWRHWRVTRTSVSSTE